MCFVTVFTISRGHAIELRYASQVSKEINLKPNLCYTTYFVACVMHLSELESLSYEAAFFRHSNYYYQTIYIKVVH